MAKANEDQAAVAASVGVTPSEFQVTLTEFCTRQSKGDKRVELIGAFHHVETSAGRMKDKESAYAARYAAFASQPA
jgi:hypothetical protein